MTLITMDDMTNEIQKLCVDTNHVNYLALEKSCVTVGKNDISSHSIGRNYPNAQVVNLQKSISYNVIHQSFLVILERKVCDQTPLLTTKVLLTTI